MRGMEEGHIKECLEGHLCWRMPMPMCARGRSNTALVCSARHTHHQQAVTMLCGEVGRHIRTGLSGMQQEVHASDCVLRSDLACGGRRATAYDVSQDSQREA